MNYSEKHYYAMGEVRKAVKPLIDQLIVINSLRPTTIKITSRGEVIQEPLDPESEKIAGQIKDLGELIYNTIMEANDIAPVLTK